MKNKIPILYLMMLCICLFTPLTVFAADNEPLYGIGSVSKVVTTVAVMKLVEEDKVDLDTPITSYIEEFQMKDKRYKDITVRMLLNHSSGIMGTTMKDAFLMGESTNDYHSILLEELKNQELKAEPGEYSVYCNDGFTLAEILVERVSGMSFGAYVKKEITEPLKMENTYMPMDVPSQETVVPIYFGNRRMPLENVASLGSGGIYSTPEDLCRLGQIFTENNRELLTEESINAMNSPQYKENKICVQEGDSSFGYGLGWDSVDAYPYSAYGMKALLKGGDTGNFGAGLTVLPKQNLSVAVTATGGSENSQVMAQEIIMEVLMEEGLLSEEEIEQTVTVEEKNEAKEIIPSEIKMSAGIYAGYGIFRVEFTEDNILKITSLENNSDMVQEYIYTKEGKFLSTGGDYISYTGLSKTAGGIGGITEFNFKEESNGKTYIMGTTYVVSSGEKQSAITVPFAEKIEENTLPQEIMEAWEQRNGKTYYLVSDSYNSKSYVNSPKIRIEQMEQFKGYTNATKDLKNCRILDANKAVCELDLPIMTGRDIGEIRFFMEDGKEYLQIGSNTYLTEEAMEDSALLNGEVKGGWYGINEEDEGENIKITVPNHSAYYVYDRYGNCVASSLLEEEKPYILLPKKGKILLTGEKGSIFQIER